MQNAKFETTIQFVVALLDTQAIRSLDVKLKLFNNCHLQILANHLLADQTLSVALLEIKHHVLVCLK
jgi:hypothetical protein